MLKKLLKYDCKSTAKSLVPFYGIVLLLSILVRITSIIKTHFPITNFVYGMMLAFFVISLIGIFFYTFFVAIKRFYTNVLKDEGYLTHTLPVKRNHIILSQTIASLGFFLLSVLVMVIALLIAFYTKGAIKNIFSAINEMFIMMETTPSIGYIYTIILIITGYMAYILTFYLALVLGHQKNKNKIVYSIIYGLVIYSVLQILSFVALGVAMIFDHNIVNVMQMETATFKDMASVFITTEILNIMIPFACYFITCKAINTKLNLE